MTGSAGPSLVAGPPLRCSSPSSLLAPSATPRQVAAATTVSSSSSEAAARETTASQSRLAVSIDTESQHAAHEAGLVSRGSGVGPWHSAHSSELGAAAAHLDFGSSPKLPHVRPPPPLPLHVGSSHRAHELAAAAAAAEATGAPNTANLGLRAAHGGGRGRAAARRRRARLHAPRRPPEKAARGGARDKTRRDNSRVSLLVGWITM